MLVRQEMGEIDSEIVKAVGHGGMAGTDLLTGPEVLRKFSFFFSPVPSAVDRGLYEYTRSEMVHWSRLHVH